VRILLHDYPGHAFPVQLSRALAARGHEVLHLHFGAFQSPKGPLAPRPDDSPTLTIEGLELGETFQKYNFVQRARQEWKYGKLLTRRAAAWKPDVVIGGNAPLDPQAMLADLCHSRGIGFVFWLQDVYGMAIRKILRRKIPILGDLVGWRYEQLERRLWRQSGQVVAITEDFVPLLQSHGVERKRIAVVENWAALDDLPQRPRQNPWSERHGLNDKRVFLYSGTLGLKHNPAALAALARNFRNQPDIRVVVITEGIGGDYLAEAKAREGLDNLILLPFQPYDELPNAVASGDVLVVLLEPDAGIYSVPSKTLTYLCAGRPILGSIPLDNLAARLIQREGAGKVADPSDDAGFLAAGAALMDDAAGRAQAAACARAYAERTFDIDAITARFEAILTAART